ncbi:MAG: hypothetical protein IID37_09780 [Planctomycetes bacterium]|nr:hypothetical protein [Planctomycetota bacterium]
MKRFGFISGLVVVSCGFVLTAGCVGQGGGSGDSGGIYRVIPELTLGDSAALEAALTAFDAARLAGDR